MHDAIEIPQYCSPQGHFLYQSGNVSDLHNVAFPVLVLDYNENAADVIPDQVLGPETDRYPRYSGTGKQRADVEAQF